MNRHLEPDFDQRLADWLEEDPNHAPREVLGTVLAAFPSIPQRRASRAPWRLQKMNPFLRLATIATLAVVLFGGALYLFKLPAAQVGAPSAGSATVEGVWDVSVTKEDALAAGIYVSTQDTAADFGHFELDLHGGFFRVTHLSAPEGTDTGQYTISGQTITFMYTTRDPYQMPFTVSATTLTIGHGGGPTYLHVKPWTRIGP